jgi:hypothetical protein
MQSADLRDCDDPSSFWGLAAAPDCLCQINELQAKDAVPVAEQITWRSLPGKCLPELLSRPLGGRVCRDSEMNNPTSMVCQNQKHVKDLKPNRRHSKEVH